MKVIVCGKGGSGKSTLSAMIARAMNKSGYNVLLVDADESNLGLHRLMGVSYPVPILDSLGGKKGFRERTASAFPQGSGAGYIKDRMKFDDIPEKCVGRTDGIRMIVIGKIHHFGEGCACPMGALSKMILPKLDIKDKEIVIIDTAAGVEHFGRGVDAVADMILMVVDPTYESSVLANNMEAMAAEAGIKIFFVLNKVDDQIKHLMIERISSEKLIAVIPKNQTVFEDNLAGKELQTTLEDINPICRLIEELNSN